MTDPPDLRDLVGDDVSEDDLDSLRRADQLLRTVPELPAGLPASLTDRVLATSSARQPWSFRRRTRALALAAALAVAVAGLFFGIGYRAGGDDFEPVRTVAMEPTEHAPQASAEIKLGPRDGTSGNWELVVDVAGLPPLPGDGYYVLWLSKDGKYAATCGTFNVGEGRTSVRMNASYPLWQFDEWVITAQTSRREERPPWLLHAPAT
jgi:hypothetical protein